MADLLFSQDLPTIANRMAQEGRLEWLLLSEVEIKRKASIVFDDGVNLLFFEQENMEKTL